MPTPQPTIYERIAQSHVDSFQGTYHGPIGAAAIIVSVEEPTEETKRALTASLKALGYAPQAIGWAQTAATNPMLLATCSPLSRASTRSALSPRVMPAPRRFHAATTRPLPLRRKHFC